MLRGGRTICRCLLLRGRLLSRGVDSFSVSHRGSRRYIEAARIGRGHARTRSDWPIGTLDIHVGRRSRELRRREIFLGGSRKLSQA